VTIDLLADLAVTLASVRPRHELAACTGMDTSVWFREPGGRKVNPEPDLATVGRATHICSRCPARRPRLDEAPDYEDTSRKIPCGIYGGVTAEQRHDDRIRHLDGCTGPQPLTVPGPWREGSTCSKPGTVSNAKWLTPTEEIFA
jgi:hypothetical protein